MSQQERATILLIDDHPMLRTGVKQLISMAPDIQVIGEASNGAQGIELAESLEAEAHRLWLLAHRMVNALARHDPQAALGFRESLVDGQISTDHVRIATPRLPSITGDTVGAWES